MKLFTIGHSNHSIDQFIQLLEDNGIELLVDVRSAPYSRYNPQFTKENLEHSLQKSGIQYAYAGKYLGGRPPDPGCYKSKVVPGEGVDYLHEVDYPEVMKQKWFQDGIDRLLELGDEQLSAVMCAEEDPANCHRHHLIAKYLIDAHPEVDVRHIRGDGNVFGAKSILTSVDNPDVEQLTLF